MSQSSINLGDQTGYNYVQNVNAGLQAVATDFSGNTEPSTKYPFMKWRDTSVSPAIMRVRNATNTAWVEEFSRVGHTHEYVPYPDTLSEDPLTPTDALTVRRGSGWLKGTLANVASFVTGVFTITLRSGAVPQTLFSILTSQSVSIKCFGATGDGTTDDGPAIRAGIAAVAGTCVSLDFGSDTYLVNSTETKQEWETVAPCIRLPNQKLTIVGSGFTLQSGTGITGLAMLQTTYGSTAEISVSGGKIRGTGNEGSYHYGLIDGAVINGETQNTNFDLIIENTKRHGYYVVDGATRNSIRSSRISNTNREMLGCGVQIEGSSDNLVIVDEMYNIGANGIDINSFTAGGYYPAVSGSPYNSSNSSSFNSVFIKKIEGTGINNSASYNGDDDYYGINIISPTTNNNYVEVGEIKSVRVSNGTISPALSTYAAAIRCGVGCVKNTVKVKMVSIVGPENSGRLVRTDGCSDCFIEVSCAQFYAAAIYAPLSETSGNTVIVKSERGSIKRKTSDGLSFYYLQQQTCTTSQDGVISGWKGSYGHTYSQIEGGIQIVVDASTFKSIYKDLYFNYQYVILFFEYNMSNTPSAAGVVALGESPWIGNTLVKDGQWHSTSFIIPYTDGTQTVLFSPNNSGTPASGATLLIRNLSIMLPNGTVIHDTESDGALNGPPTTGAYLVADRVKNCVPGSGVARAWVCTVSGTPGTWVSEGTL